MEKKTRKYAGFTLMELIIVIGMIALLLTIAISAINPTKQLNEARGVNRNVAKRELENAVIQYVIDGNSLSGVPTGISNALDICQDTVAPATCSGNGDFDLSFLTTNSTYLTSLPIDPNETGSLITGYRIYLDGSFNKICSVVLDTPCGP